MLFNYKDTKGNQSGNVLFLILIAVALFAALSYAVTQSTRSGGGSTSNETAGINAAQTTQYPASVRTAVVRMIISGVDATNLEFNPASAFGTLTSPEFGVFHPNGGGATHVQAPAVIMADGNPGEWFFNPEFEIVNIGTSVGTDDAGNDYIAFLPGITESICTRINSDLGVSGNTTISSAPAATRYTTNMVTGYTPPGDEFVLGTGSSDGLAGQPFGCFTNDVPNPVEHVYYHMILEQ